MSRPTRILLFLSIFLLPTVFSFGQASDEADTLRHEPNFFRILETEDDALQCRYDLIREAKSEILLSYYIFRDDETGRNILRLLVEAARRGVQVRLLMDWSGSKIARKYVAYLLDVGVEVRYFKLQRFWTMRRLTHRMHDKLILVDSHQLIVGGRNIKNEYYKKGETLNFRDRDALAIGQPIGNRARNHFFAFWNNAKISERAEKRELTAKQWVKIEAKLRDHADPRTDNPTCNWLDGCCPTRNPIEFANDHYSKRVGRILEETDEKDYGSTTVLIGLIDSAKHSIIIENAYFNPSKRWLRAIQRALDRGVKIQMLTNSAKSNDMPIQQGAYMNRRKKLLKMGIEIWEFQGPETFHTKAFLIDDRITAIGSYNLNFLSEHMNTELAVWVVDSAVSKEHRAMIAEDLANSVQIGPDNCPIHPTDKPYEAASFARRLLIWLCRFTVAGIVERG